jgi:hypothetical protein
VSAAGQAPEVAAGRVRQVMTVLVAALGLLVVSSSGADAHTRTQETTNLDSRITAEPDLPGVSWKVYTGGLLVEVVNDSDEVLVVEGYEGEPYLRIGPEGVERNRRSPASYLNDDRIGRRVSARTDIAMPRGVVPFLPPPRGSGGTTTASTGCPPSRLASSTRDRSPLP